MLSKCQLTVTDLMWMFQICVVHFTLKEKGKTRPAGENMADYLRV